MEFWGEWEPLWHASWYLDFRTWGHNPVGYHLTNVFWLFVAVFALFWFVREAWPESALAAWSAGLLFATHPLHDEAVTYLAARGHTMAAALAIVVLALYARFRSGSHGRLGRAALLSAALVTAFLAALAKEVALVLPAWIAVFECLNKSTVSFMELILSLFSINNPLASRT